MVGENVGGAVHVCSPVYTFAHLDHSQAVRKQYGTQLCIGLNGILYIHHYSLLQLVDIFCSAFENVVLQCSPQKQVKGG